MKAYGRVLILVLMTANPLLLLARAEDNAHGQQFDVKFDRGAMVQLKRAGVPGAVEFLGRGRRLGDLLIKYRRNKGDWQSVNTTEFSDVGEYSSNADGTKYEARYSITNGPSAVFSLQARFVVRDREVIWSFNLENLSGVPLEIGDLALPLPVGVRGRRSGAGARSPVILKHSFISGNGSFIFWTPLNRAGPYLTMTPLDDTSFEYWEAPRGGYRIFIHSAAAGAIAKEHGTKWRQPNTSLTLAPTGHRGDRQTYGVKFRWADDYDAVRQILVDEGKIDVHVIPGMTVPTNLSAQIALRTREPIRSVLAEFPMATRIKPLGRKGETPLYEVRFSKLGENELTVRYGNNQHIFLEFFVTEPLEILIRKRAAFIADHQVRDTNKWYNGLFCDWNMETHVQVTPDNYDRLRGFRIYAATCDDAGLGHPAYLAAENAEYPTQREVTDLDYYIKNFVWGGLQRTTHETYSYGIYGIPDWKKNRDSTDPGRNGQLHLWRVYDYPHVILLYFSLYRTAKFHPEIKTAMTAREYLQRAYGTARAMYTVPHEVWNGWSAYGTGFYNELVIIDLIDALQANGMTDQAKTLRDFWLRKVKNFVNGRQDLFRSEYAFDSTGFESTEAIARYAVRHADKPGVTNSGIPMANAERFMQVQMADNLFCRGWLEPAYYYLGSDYRGGAGNAYTLSYMAQMGGWSVLDYGLHFATNASPYLRLGYASFLSSWALLNSGTPDSDYGYWYPGKTNDGGAGGGFEPAPYGTTWLGQPHHRGSWYYACEIDLGFCGALRGAATVLEDDPIFGRVCLGGDWHKTKRGLEIVPRDGVRRRFFARIGNRKLDLVLRNDRFAKARPIVLKQDLSQIRFEVESGNPVRHIATLQLSGLVGNYTVRGNHGTEGVFVNSADKQQAAVVLSIDSGIAPQRFTIVKE